MCKMSLVTCQQMGGGGLNGEDKHIPPLKNKNIITFLLANGLARNSPDIFTLMRL